MGLFSISLLKKIDISYFVFFIIVTVILSFFQITILEHYDSFKNILYCLSAMFSGYVFIKLRVYEKFNNYATLLFIIFSIYMLYHVIIGSNLNEDVFKSGSRNYISVYGLVYTIIAILSCKNKFNKYCVIFVNLYIAMLAQGRAGLISSLIVSFIFVLDKDIKYKFIYYTLIASIVFYIFYSYNVIEFILSRFSEQGFGDTGRSDILTCYYDNFNLSNFFFGINYGGYDYCGTLAIGRYSLHNSFLSLYSFFGIFSFLIFIMIFLFFIFSIKDKNYINIILMLALLFRSFTDVVIFFTPIDFIFWVLILSGFIHRAECTKSEF